MFDYNSISFEVRERARSRERDAERERLVRSIRTRVRKEHAAIAAVLRRVRLAGGL